MRPPTDAGRDVDAPCGAGSVRSGAGRPRAAPVVFGVLVGGCLLAVLAGSVATSIPRESVAWLVAALTLVFAGVVTGHVYGRPGIPEGVGVGLLLAGVAWGLLAGVLGLGVAPLHLLVSFLGAPLLWLTGSWVGDVLRRGGRQGSGPVPLRPGSAGVPLGLVLGFVMSSYAVFVGYALFGLDAPGIFSAFCGSFVVTGLAVALMAPGLPLLSVTAGAMGVVVLDFTIALTVFSSPFPPASLLVGILLVGGLTLAGGGVGRVLRRLAASHR